MSHAETSPSPKQTKVLDRVLSHVWFKAIGSSVVIPVFFVAYFWVMNHPIGAVTTMPLLAPDRWVPLLPWSAWVYFSLWVYICMPSSLMMELRELGHYLLGAALLSVVGLSVFFFLPTQVPDWGIDWAQYPTLLFLKESDASGNACPSLHVAFAVYSGCWLVRILKVLSLAPGWHRANWLWCVLIVLSTMSTKQHVFVDVICGAALGALVFWLNDRLCNVACELVSRRTCGGERDSAPFRGSDSPESRPISYLSSRDGLRDTEARTLRYQNPANRSSNRT